MVKAIGDDLTWLTAHSEEFVLAVGPGLGATSWSQSLLKSCLEADTPLVVDADGLNLLAGLCAQKTVTRNDWILTPHPGEAARLLACKVSEVQRDRVLAATTIAARFNAHVVLKGCGTIIADPGGQYAICPLGNPGMATAGSGDVLTGVLVALLAQGLDCFDASRAGVLAHAAAGDLAASASGEMALMAGDIIKNLAGVWRSAAT
jgi:NAD(P)H-hydrate epimerase